MPGSIAGSIATGRTPGRWRGVALLALRAGWAISTAVVLILFVASLPARLDYLGSLPLGLQAILARVGIPVRVYADMTLGFDALYLLSSLLIAGFITWRKPHDLMAQFVAVFLVTFVGNTSSTIGSAALLRSDINLCQALLGAVGYIGLNGLFYLFPDGRFVPRWTWIMFVVAVIGQVPFSLPDTSPYNPNSWPIPFLLPLLLAIFGTAIFAQIYRYLRVSSSSQRQQTKWVVYGLVLAIVLMFIARSTEFGHDQPASLLSLFHDPLLDLAYGLIPWSIGASVFRYRLWDIDVIISRTLIYSALTASVVGLYVLIVGYIGTALQVGNTLVISVVGAGAVAVVFQPLREFLQRGVNRLMYGERDDPYAVLSHLGKQLEATLTQEVALPTIMEVVAHALRLPYVAIMLWQGDVRAVVAAHGAPTGDALTLPLTYGHEAVGEFILGLRAGESKFSAADQRLLADLARQVSVMAYAVRLTSDLRRSRERLVSAREEERLRLRRDLHDGMGPTLASLAQRLDVIGALVPRDPGAALEQISEVKAQVKTTITDIRRIVYALRPPALDEYGLAGALRELAARCEEINGLTVVFSAPEDLPALPAAVEVAAYYIATEALNNVVRHAQAQTCSIRLGSGDTLGVEVIDDGHGLPADYRFGIGMTSMRERATELGGTCLIEPNGARGVRVNAHLPIVGAG